MSSHTGSDDWLSLHFFICSAPFSSIQFIFKVLSWLTYFELLSCAKKYLENFVTIFFELFLIVKDYNCTLLRSIDQNIIIGGDHYSSVKWVFPHFLDGNSWSSERLTDLLESRTRVWRSVQGLFSGSFKYFFLMLAHICINQYTITCLLVCSNNRSDNICLSKWLATFVCQNDWP